VIYYLVLLFYSLIFSYKKIWGFVSIVRNSRINRDMIIPSQYDVKKLKSIAILFNHNVIFMWKITY